MIVNSTQPSNKDPKFARRQFYVYKRINGEIKEKPASFEDALKKVFKEQEMINNVRK